VLVLNDPAQVPLAAHQAPQPRLLPAQRLLAVSQEAERLCLFTQLPMQDLVQSLPCTMQLQFQRAQAQREPLGHLALRLLLQIAPLDQLAGALFKVRERPIEQHLPILVFQFFDRIEGSRIGHMKALLVQVFG
jgi:hypothetical protein